MIGRTIIYGLAILCPSAAMAQGSPLDRLIGGLVGPVYRDNLPTDVPLLPWVHYNYDSKGRPTYLSEQCMGAAFDSTFRRCSQVEIAAHADLLEKHQADDDRRAKAAQMAAQEQEKTENEPAFLAERIVGWKRQIASYQRRLDQEHEVGRVSGYEDRDILYQCGAAIVRLRNQITRAYADYRSHGGEKSLEKIQ